MESRRRYPQKKAQSQRQSRGQSICAVVNGGMRFGEGVSYLLLLSVILAACSLLMDARLQDPAQRSHLLLGAIRTLHIWIMLLIISYVWLFDATYDALFAIGVFLLVAHRYLVNESWLSYVEKKVMDPGYTLGEAPQAHPFLDPLLPYAAQRWFVHATFGSGLLVFVRILLCSGYFGRLMMTIGALALGIVVAFLAVAWTSAGNRVIASAWQPGRKMTYAEAIANNPRRQYITRRAPVYVFFHAGTPGGREDPAWQAIVEEQLEALRSSGLYDLSDAVFYGCNGDACGSLLGDFFERKGYAKLRPASAAIREKERTWENPTLNAMIAFAKRLAAQGNKDAHVLYLHTKGVTGKSSSQNAHRRFMMYWLVDKHAVCRDLLDRGFHTVGALYLSNRIYPKIYSGNFFWATADYLSKLQEIEKLGNRYEAECVLLSKHERGRHISLTDEAYLNLYLLPKYWYRTGLYRDNIPIVKPASDAEIVLKVF